MLSKNYWVSLTIIKEKSRSMTERKTMWVGYPLAEWVSSNLEVDEVEVVYL